MSTKSKKTMTIQEKVRTYLAKENELAQSLGLNRTLVIDFPKHKEVPIVALLASKILNWYGAQLDMRFSEIKKN